MDRLYDMSAARNLIGCLLQNPRVLISGKYKITREDFSPCLVHKYLFATIENLTAMGIAEITWMDIDQYVEPYEEVVECFTDNHTEDFVSTIVTLVNADNIELYYNQIKKFSALREYRDNGCNIEKFFDIMKEDETQLKNLSQYSLEDIIDHFDSINTKIKRKYDKRNGSKTYIPIADVLKQRVQDYKETPIQGACLQSSYLTTIFNGALRGHFFLRSGNSGSGKTTLAVGDVCTLCATELYDEEYDCWVENVNRQGGALHIHTESETESEVVTIYLAHIAKVDRNKITKGMMNEEEEERVFRATEILEESNIFFEYDPKFSIPSIKELIREYKTRMGDELYMVFFDYMQINGVFNSQLIEQYKAYISDPQALLMLSDECKLMAESFDVFMESGTQLNDNIKTAEFADESCLSGAKAIKNKLDGGCISTYLKPKELKQIEDYIDKKGFSHMRPNRVQHVYKARFNSTGYDKIKVFQYVNLGTGVSTDLFCTNEKNELISIARTVPRAIE